MNHLGFSIIDVPYLTFLLLVRSRILVLSCTPHSPLVSNHAILFQSPSHALYCTVVSEQYMSLKFRSTDFIVLMNVLRAACH